MKPASRVAAIALILGLLETIAPARLAAAPGTLLNGDFSKGSGGSPEGWRTESWVNRPTTTYTWIKPTDSQSGQVVITSTGPNDARWTQSLVFDPGTYFVSADVRTERVSRAVGASISLADEGVASLDVTGDSGWRTLGFFLHVDGKPEKAELKLRLGGFKNFATGRAYFRDARVDRIDRLPEGALSFDLQELRERWRGGSWPTALVLIGLASATVFGWRLFSGLPVVPARWRSNSMSRPPRAS